MEKLIYDICISELDKFVKLFVFKNENNTFYDTEKYFEKYGTKTQFETCSVYLKYKTYKLSSEYQDDLNKLIKEFKDDIINGYYSRMEEIINMTDDDDDDYEKWITYRNNFDKTFEYISNQYDKDYYYPTFSSSWLYYIFEDRL